MLKKYLHAGLTLIELVIALAVSAIVVAGLISMFFITTKHSHSTLDITRLDNQLYVVVNKITRDIQRSGYWANATSSSNNPFMVTGSTDITTNAANNCILMTYDANNDGLLPSISSSVDDERYGYRLVNNTIQFRPYGAPFSCIAATNSWTDLTDPSLVQITQFSVILNAENVDVDGTGPGTATISVRSVSMSITGQLTNDSSVNKTLQKTIKVYNDKYNP